MFSWRILRVIFVKLNFTYHLIWSWQNKIGKNEDILELWSDENFFIDYSVVN